jgi:hypothetical protein
LFKTGQQPWALHEDLPPSAAASQNSLADSLPLAYFQRDFY